MFKAISRFNIKRIGHGVQSRLTTLGELYRGRIIGYRSSGRIANTIKAGVGIRFPFRSNINISSNSYIENDVHFTISRNAKVNIGSDVWISRGGHICANRSITIGDSVLIGEYTSIRDSTHSYIDPDIEIKKQPDVHASIIICNDVWIGRGCLIQSQGSKLVIGKGAVIAAHSVVTRCIPPFQIWGGTPAKFIKNRSV